MLTSYYVVYTPLAMQQNVCAQVYTPPITWCFFDGLKCAEGLLQSITVLLNYMMQGHSCVHIRAPLLCNGGCSIFSNNSKNRYTFQMH